MLNSFQHPSLRPHHATSAGMAKDPCVYILSSQPRGTLYVGVTSDLLARLHQHREGKGRSFTSRYGVFRLVRFELFGDMEAAILREKQLKRWHRSWKTNQIDRGNPHWLDLSISLGFDPKPPRNRTSPSC